MKTVSILTLVFSLACLVSAQDSAWSTIIEESGVGGPTGDYTTNGVITPLDQEMRNFYVRNSDGAIEVKLDDALVGLQTRIQRGGFEARKVEFGIGGQKFSYNLPQKLYVKRTFKDAKTVEAFLKHRERGAYFGKIYTTPIEDHLPTAQEPWIAGRVLKENGKFIDVGVGDEVFKISTTGHDGQHRFMGLLTHKDIKPFVQQAFVHGYMKDNVFHANEVGIRMLEDAKAKDDPNLGRYLFIGDSISGNYDKALRAALKGKLNLYHPPTNCGSSSKGVANIGQWLGAFDQPGLGWDIISFNFGHWDSKNNKENYQANLETIITELKKTKAKLIYVTTTPIPQGYAEAGEIGEDGKATGRVQQTMKRYINPWALEVMKRHPEISICDQHSMIVNEAFYGIWMAKAGTKSGRSSKEYGDLHIGGLLGQPAGRQLARAVLDKLGRAGEMLSPHSLSDHDLDPDRQRAATRGMDVEDFLDLLNSDKRLRKYNR